MLPYDLGSQEQRSACRLLGDVASTMMCCHTREAAITALKTCAPCNYSRMDFTLDELGLRGPRYSEPVRSSWDGLERFRRLGAR